MLIARVAEHAGPYPKTKIWKTASARSASDKIVEKARKLLTALATRSQE